MPDKNTPWSKRAPFDSESITCGRCDSDISDSDFEYCPYCGQKLDWSCLSDSETSFEFDGKTYKELLMKQLQNVKKNYIKHME